MGGDNNPLTLAISITFGVLALLLPVLIWWFFVFRRRLFSRRRYIMLLLFIVFAGTPLWVYWGRYGVYEAGQFYQQIKHTQKICRNRNGLNIHESQDSTREEIECKNGVRNGRFTRYANGVLTYEAHYTNDKLNGLEKRYYDDGQINIETEYKDGKKDGTEVYYDENGSTTLYVINSEEGSKQLYYTSPEDSPQDVSLESQKLLCSKPEQYLNISARYTCHGNLFDGIYEALNTSTGEVYLRQGYKDGIFHGTNISYSDGEIRNYMEYQNGILHGNVYKKETDYDTTVYEGQYMNGLQEGIFRMYDYKGNLQSEVLFEKGKVVNVLHP